MEEEEVIHLLDSAQAALRHGGRIVVVGWKGSNHNQKTLRLEKSGKVIFAAGKRAKEVGGKTDLVILTRFVSHSHTEAMQKKGLNVYPHTVGLGIIRRVLNECTNLIATLTEPEAPADPDDAAEEQLPVDSLAELEQFIMTTENNVETIDRFAMRFTEEAEAHAEELVSSYTLGKILQELKMCEKPVELVKTGYLKGITLPNKKKTGWYKATPKLLERLSTNIGEEPTDPIEKAEYLLANESAIHERLREAREVVAHWETQANRVEKAKELLKQLSEI